MFVSYFLFENVPQNYMFGTHIPNRTLHFVMQMTKYGCRATRSGRRKDYENLEGGQKCSSSITNEEFNIFLALGWHNK